ncbi:MAG: DUF4139 domain-containing protein [Bacteroidia bacterium]|nr:DUF4139 domain-containing protein [Bacteroidia bacterium]
MRMNSITKNTLFILVFLISLVSQAQVTKYCPTSIDEVSVFRNQAQVHRKGKVFLAEGVQTVIIEKISPYLLQESIEAKSSSNVEILSVRVQNDYLKEEEKPNYIVDLEDSLEKINEGLADIRGDKEAISMQRDLLIANKNLGGTQGVKAEELEDVLSIYQKKFHDFKVEKSALDKKEKELLVRKRKIDEQLREFNQGTMSVSNKVVLQVRNLKFGMESEFELTYLVKGIRWTPLYDIRVTDTKSPIKFYLKAQITQNTGENWSNVKLKLATNNPNSGGSKPVLHPVKIYFNQVVANKKNVYSYSEEPTVAMEEMTVESDFNGYRGNARVSQNAVSMEFEVPGKQSIPSDKKGQMIDISSFSSNAVYGHACVPKLSKDVFVTAKIESNDLISQLNGEASIYFGGSFTGKTYLSQSASDSLLITLGTDKRLVSKREKVNEMCTKSFFGSTRKDANTIEITLSNNSNETIELDLEDQVPLTTNQEITVKLTDKGGSDFDLESGKLTWKVKLLPKQTSKFRFTFEISYPSNKIISPF